VGEYRRCVSGTALWTGGNAVAVVGGDCLRDHKSQEHYLKIRREDSLSDGLVQVRKRICCKVRGKQFLISHLDL